MGSLRGRLSKLEGEAEQFYTVLRLPDGSPVRYTSNETLGAAEAAIRREDNALLARFMEADTTEGLPGLCRALVGGRGRG